MKHICKEKILPYLDIETVLSTYGIQHKRAGANIQMLCPNPGHADRHMGNCVYNIKKNYFHCFACGASGNMGDIVAYALYGENSGKAFYNALKDMEERFGIDGEEELKQEEGIRYLNENDAKFLGLSTSSIENTIEDENGEKIYSEEYLSPLNDMYRHDRKAYEYIVKTKYAEKFNKINEIIEEEQNLLQHYEISGRLRDKYLAMAFLKEYEEKKERMEKIRVKYKIPV